MCHVSRVTCNVSHVTCNFFFFFFFQQKILQSGGAIRWKVFYQRGLPRLVLTDPHSWLPKLYCCPISTLLTALYYIDVCSSLHCWVPHNALLTAPYCTADYPPYHCKINCWLPPTALMTSHNKLLTAPQYTADCLTLPSITLMSTSHYTADCHTLHFWLPPTKPLTASWIHCHYYTGDFWLPHTKLMTSHYYTAPCNAGDFPSLHCWLPLITLLTAIHYTAAKMYYFPNWD